MSYGRRFCSSQVFLSNDRGLQDAEVIRHTDGGQADLGYRWAWVNILLHRNSDNIKWQKRKRLWRGKV
jgi:hypothetical protein